MIHAREFTAVTGVMTNPDRTRAVKEGHMPTWWNSCAN
jgi:hypothetical protein